jgi:hypothetical protein
MSRNASRLRSLLFREGYNRRVPQTVVSAPGRVLRGLATAFGARMKTFVLVAAAVFCLDVFVPPVVLSLARKPVDFFTFNPWLKRLPEYLASGKGSLAERLERTWGLALFWFSADSPYGVDWGFAVTVSDLARFVLMALIIGAYFALWLHRRDRMKGAGWGTQGGVLGAVSSVFGLATGGCTVMGCGAPVIPVVGLAFAGLTSTTLTWLSEVSAVATAAVLVGMGASVLYLAWRVGAERPTSL